VHTIVGTTRHFHHVAQLSHTARTRRAKRNLPHAQGVDGGRKSPPKRSWTGHPPPIPQERHKNHSIPDKNPEKEIDRQNRNSDAVNGRRSERMATYEFPVSDDITRPPVGCGFDLIAGMPLDYAALDSPVLQSQDVTAGDSSFSMTQDTTSYTDAIHKQLDISGSGWGASVGLSLSQSSFSASNSSAITVNLDAFQARRQAMVDPKAALSAEAAALWKSAPAKFAAKYGDHFVAGYIYGKRISLAYNMQFSSEQEKEDFSLSLSASYAGADFSASMSAAIHTAQTSSQSHLATSFTNHYAGFSAPSPSQFSDLASIKAAYDSAEIDTSTVAIRIIVAPWHYLECISNSVGLYQNDELDQLTRLVSGVGYVVRSCDDFMDRNLYAGSHQLNAVQAVRADAESQLEAMSSFLSSIAKTQTPATQSDLARYQPIGPLKDRLSLALSNFVIAFKVTLNTSKDDDCNCFLKDVNGSPIGYQGGNVFECSKGTYLNWSLEGNDQWLDTKGTPKNFFVIARMIKNGQISGTVLAVIDRAAGTLQLWNLGIDSEGWDQSKSVPIRGVDNSLACDDPQNRFAINFFGPTLQRTLIASVI